jgi:molybdopterin/thiamine biosynthesis adenylyltransferase
MVKAEAHMSQFTDEDLDRYARHLVLREIGGPGQQRLRAARVLVVGAGGLGAPAALYLAAAGVGHIGIVDPDVVDISNLQRQVIYGEADVGEPKAFVAPQRLRQLNRHSHIEPLPVALDDHNAADIVRPYDVVLDGTDDFSTRFAVNRACVAGGKLLVSGAIGRWSGQVGVFGAGLRRGASPCYQCLVPEIPPDAETCARVGVVGALAGVIGSMMALEAIKAITGAGETLEGRLLVYDALDAEIRTVKVGPDPACAACSDIGTSGA